MLPPQIRKELLRHYRAPGPATLLLRFAQENAFIYWDADERAAQVEGRAAAPRA
jgi:hypothetical protein